jgi:WD40-like Beta Propeller Repeat
LLRLAFAIGCAALFLAAGPAGGASSPRPWILYAGDWSGSMEIFAADPSGVSSVRQVTFGRPAGSCTSPVACGFTDPLPSPDGREVAYWTVGFANRSLWVSRVDGVGARELGLARGAAWTPDSKRLDYSAADGAHELTIATGDDRIVSRTAGGVPEQAGGSGEIGSTWSPDGRTFAYATRQGVFVARAQGGGARIVYRFTEQDVNPVLPFPFELALAPNSRWLAFDLNAQVVILDLRTHRMRRVADVAHDLAWSPDSGRLMVVDGRLGTDGSSITTGDVRTVTPDGHVRIVVSHSAAYGGQILAAAWTAPPRGLSYRAPAPVDGVFAGGPIQEIAADGSRVGYIACGGVSAWTVGSSSVVPVESPSDCEATYSRGHTYSLAVAGDRLVWFEKGWGLCFLWQAREATIGSAPTQIGGGTGCLGSAPLHGLGTAVGSGSLLVISGWTMHWVGAPFPVVDEQSIERVDGSSCPCTELSSSPGPYTPLDVDAGRIVVNGDNETRILAADGSILVSLRVPTQAAQLSGSQLVLAVDDQLRVYDAGTGALESSWPLPAQPVGHDCDSYGDPSCRPPLRITLDDVARSLAVYSVDGAIHLLRLSDGVDRVIAPGTLGRFVDTGLVFADGARIRLVPYAKLPIS